MAVNGTIPLTLAAAMTALDAADTQVRDVRKLHGERLIRRRWKTAFSLPQTTAEVV